MVAGDQLDPASPDHAFAGVDVAYYRVHSMGPTATPRNGSRGRPQFGDAVIASGSLSFELIRVLVERLPVMICPWWVSTLAQPIGIDDVLAYLAAALHLPGAENHTLDIGGADQATYGDGMREYARQRGLKRLMLSVPLLTLRVSSLWLGLVTPVHARVGRELIAGLKNRSGVTDHTARAMFPIRPIGLRDAIGRAIRCEDRVFALTRWSDARSSGGSTVSPADTRFRGRVTDRRQIHVALDADRAFVPIERIGGQRGWYDATWLWRIRGAIDLLVGGVGMRRGRRDPNTPAVGATLDFWRVEAYEPGRRLRLAAEMRVCLAVLHEQAASDKLAHDDVTCLLAEFVEGPPGPALSHAFKHRLLRQERR